MNKHLFDMMEVSYNLLEEIKFYHCRKCQKAIASSRKPDTIKLNEEWYKECQYENEEGE